MGRKRQSANITDFFKKITFPYDQAAKVKEEGKLPVTMSPFADARSVEQSFAVKIAMENGITFQHVPRNIQMNCAEHPSNDFKAELIQDYAAYQRDGWFPQEFSAQDALAKFEASIRSAVEKQLSATQTPEVRSGR